MNNSITDSWNANAYEWIALLNRSGIPSRSITNQAIIDIVSASAKQNILDIGCGEGWLTRALSKQGFIVSGVDATQLLIEEAQTRSSNKFFQSTYEEIIKGKKIEGAPFDTIVFNYSLYEDESTGPLLRALASSLTPDGKLIIQTVHPNFLTQQGQSYVSRWINNAWEGLDGNFTSPHAWYARTMDDWLDIFREANYEVEHQHGILNHVGKLISVIFVVQKNRY